MHSNQGLLEGVEGGRVQHLLLDLGTVRAPGHQEELLLLAGLGGSLALVLILVVVQPVPDHISGESCFCENPLWQWSQTKGRSPVWILLCDCKFVVSANRAPHRSQTNGRSPVCVRSCLVFCPFNRNLNCSVSHVVVSESWLTVWCRRYIDRAFLQCEFFYELLNFQIVKMIYYIRHMYRVSRRYEFDNEAKDLYDEQIHGHRLDILVHLTLN